MSQLNRHFQRMNAILAVLGVGSFICVPLVLITVTRMVLGTVPSFADKGFNVSMAWTSLVPGIFLGLLLINRNDLPSGLAITLIGIATGIVATALILYPPVLFTIPW